jgi:hypothetical protein
MLKQKQISAIEKVQHAAQLGGLALMTIGAGLLVADLPHAFGSEEKRQAGLAPQMAVVNYNDAFNNTNKERREREETGPHYVSYGISQRTPSRTSK